MQLVVKPGGRLSAGLRFWLYWLALTSAVDGFGLYFDRKLLARPRWEWVHAIHPSEALWAGLFFAVAFFAVAAAVTHRRTFALIALGASIPLNVIFAIAILDSTFDEGGAPGLIFSKWLTQAVVSAFMLTRPMTLCVVVAKD